MPEPREFFNERKAQKLKWRTQEDRTMTIGYDKPLHVLPFDHRATFSKTMFGWKGELTAEQTAEIAAVAAARRGGKESLT
jgi:hypothetical protein